jgi:hypothetical protein
MNKAQARARIRLLTEADYHPTLTEDHLDYLVEQCAVSPVADPTLDTYTGDALIARSVAEGWGLKLGRCAGDYDFRDAAGQEFDRAKVFEHCEAMVKKWAGTLKTTYSGGRTGISAAPITAPDVTKLIL